MKHSVELEQVFSIMAGYASSYNHRYVTLEHLLRAVLDSATMYEVVDVFDIDRNKLVKATDVQLKSIETLKDGQQPVPTNSLLKLYDGCQDFLDENNRKILEVVDVIYLMLCADETWAQYLLMSNGLEKQSFLEYIATFDEFSEDSKSKKKKKNKPDIDYTVNMTALAKNGQYDKLVGRQEEIMRTIEILCRRQKNNPIHVGECGVGKTAITEGLANLIVEGKVPDKLKGYEIYSLDVASMVAGTEYRGAFEKRLKKTLKAIIAHGKVIIYIDEIHSIVGAGDVSGSLDLGGILKPYLSRGQIRCIGATTYDDYKQKFQKDKALDRRFQKIDICEPSAEETFEILKGVKDRYETFHKVKYSDEILKYVIDVTSKFMSDRHFPDKAIDIVDELGSHVALYREQQPEITKSDVDELVSRVAKVPLTQMNQDEMLNMSNLEQNLKKYIFAQDKAIETISNAIKCHRVGLGNPDKPIGSFLFIGPTGVGKTELCRVLSKELGVQLLRYDMSEFMEKHTISRLLGAPPGYVGFEQGTSLTDAIRKNPHCILLLDEIEKAHPDIFNSLLQIMDYATITDSTGRQADFRNVLIIMTSNVGSAELSSCKIGFNNLSTEGGKLAGDPFEAVKNTFSPEFRNRLDDIILFNRLEKSSIVKIVNKYLNQLQVQLQSKKIEFTYDQAVVDYLADKGYDPAYGARPMARLIQNEIRNRLTQKILSENGKIEKVKATMIEQKIIIE